MDSLDIKVRVFANALEVSETNIRNYISRDSKPSSDILERIVRNYPQVNTAWLITGEGQPFLPEAGKTDEQAINYQKNISGNNIGVNHGKASQQQGAIPSNEAALLKEIEHLKAQLVMKDQVIASKDETIDLLKAAFNRPN